MGCVAISISCHSTCVSLWRIDTIIIPTHIILSKHSQSSSSSSFSKNLAANFCTFVHTCTLFEDNLVMVSSTKLRQKFIKINSKLCTKPSPKPKHAESTCRIKDQFKIQLTYWGDTEYHQRWPTTLNSSDIDNCNQEQCQHNFIH